MSVLLDAAGLTQVMIFSACHQPFRHYWRTQAAAGSAARRLLTTVGD